MITRKSRQKETILKVLRKTTTHPDAEWIYRQVRKEIPNVSLGTIYRNLKVLKDAGVIRSVCASSGVEHFDARTGEHDHFRCSRCGRIFDLEVRSSRASEKKIADSTGFKIAGHSLEFSGLCRECQN